MHPTILAAFVGKEKSSLYFHKYLKLR